MDMPYGGRSECDSTHRNVFPPRHSVNRTGVSSLAYRHQGCVGRWPAVCSRSPANSGGLAGLSTSPPHSHSELKWGPVVTVLRSATAARRNRAGS